MRALAPTSPAAANGHEKRNVVSKRKVAPSDVVVSFPDENRIQFQSESLFSDPRSEASLQFFERAFLATEVESVEINGNKHRA